MRALNHSSLGRPKSLIPSIPHAENADPPICLHPVKYHVQVLQPPLCQRILVQQSNADTAANHRTATEAAQSWALIICLHFLPAGTHAAPQKKNTASCSLANPFAPAAETGNINKQQTQM